MLKSKRVDLYSILIRNGYKMTPYSNIMTIREEIFNFLHRQVGLNYDLTSCLASYSDNQWSKLVIRLKKHGHVLELI